MQTSPNTQPESASKKQKSDWVLPLFGAIAFFGGMLACIIPQTLVPVGSGDTEGAWLAGFSALFLGIPLFVLGVILLVVAAVQSGKKDKNESRKPLE